MQFNQQIEINRRMLINDIFRRLEAALGPFQIALDTFLATLFQARLPADWRQQWHTFVAAQATAGFIVEPKSVAEMEQWIEAWAKFCDLLPVDQAHHASETEPSGESIRAAGETNQTHIQPGAALREFVETPEGRELSTDVRSTSQQLPAGGPRGDRAKFAAQAEGAVADKPKSGSRRGDQTKFYTEAEEIVSKETGVPQNREPMKKIAGSGKGGYRYLDKKFRGPRGSVRIRGTVIEVKASTAETFGALSGRSRKQILDAVKFVERLRNKASLVKDPIIKAKLEAAHVEVFSDLPKPKRGKFAELITQKYIEWKPIPRPKQPVGSGPRAVRPAVRRSLRSMGKPGLGAARNLALGVIASLAEAGVAEAAYRDTATMLKDLLDQIDRNNDADEAEWDAIRDKLDEIENMKQSWLGATWEAVSFGQGSIVEKQAMAMAQLAWKLGRKFGYENERTWGEFFRGKFGRFKREKKEE